LSKIVNCLCTRYEHDHLHVTEKTWKYRIESMNNGVTLEAKQQAKDQTTQQSAAAREKAKPNSLTPHQSIRTAETHRPHPTIPFTHFQFRSIFGEQSEDQIHHIPVWKSTSVERWKEKPKWNLQSRPSTFVQGEQRS